MRPLLRVFAILALFASLNLRAAVPEHSTLYGITEGIKVAEVESKLGKVTKRIPFDDGWVAFAFKLQNHNLIVETAPGDPERIASVQIEGKQNPAGMGLAGVNLGDNIDVVIKKFGTPSEQKQSIDEASNKPIPNSYTYSYQSASFESVKGVITSIKINFSAPSNRNPNNPAKVSNSRIGPPELLAYVYQQLQAHFNSSYHCTDISSVSADDFKTSATGVASEHWVSNACGQTRVVRTILTPDGSGGYLVAFGE